MIVNSNLSAPKYIAIDRAASRIPRGPWDWTSLLFLETSLDTRSSWDRPSSKDTRSFKYLLSSQQPMGIATSKPPKAPKYGLKISRASPKIQNPIKNAQKYPFQPKKGEALHRTKNHLPPWTKNSFDLLTGTSSEEHFIIISTMMVFPWKGSP